MDLYNIPRNWLRIKQLAVVRSLSLKSANSTICYTDVEYSGMKCGMIPLRYSAFYTLSNSVFPGNACSVPWETRFQV